MSQTVNLTGRGALLSLLSRPGTARCSPKVAAMFRAPGQKSLVIADVG